MSDKRNGSAAGGGGVGILSLLFLLFVGLKLTGHIDWSWWWVSAPLWGGCGFAVVVALGVLGAFLAFGGGEK